MSAYFTNIGNAVSTLWTGLKLTLRHMYNARHSAKPIHISEEGYFRQTEGIATLQYPHESLPIPDNGRYRLHNEIDDCIVCDKCAKICPVDCIDIEPIKAKESFGKTSDGTPKRIYAAKFDIDMGKCCFCGLCTTVCPTECLTMTKAYDFSEYDVDDHIYSFATMTPVEILTKRQELQTHEEKKTESSKSAISAVKPSFQRPIGNPPAAAKSQIKPKTKPVVKPKPVIKKKKEDDDS